MLMLSLMIKLMLSVRMGVCLPLPLAQRMSASYRGEGGGFTSSEGREGREAVRRGRWEGWRGGEKGEGEGGHMRNKGRCLGEAGR